jgi:hypothetical protein
MPETGFCVSPEPRIFTPRIKSRLYADNGWRRLRLQLSPEDWAKVRRGKWSATITDLVTGRRYRARGASCGADCYCDAIVTLIHGALGPTNKET